MSGSRQHTIPRFLLKGFASALRGDEVFVWMCRKNEQPAERNIKNVAVDRNFYGKPGDSDVDAAITALETDYVSLIDWLRAAKKSSAVDDVRIPSLIGHLVVRSRWLRESFTDCIETIMNELQGHLSRKETLVAAISKDPEIRERLISECLSDGWDLKTAKRAVSKFAPHIPEFVETNMEAFRSMVNEQFALVRPVTPRATRDAHLAALAKDPGANRRADVYAALHWFVVRTEKPLWLADSVCIFETRGHRRFKPMNDGDDELVRVYLPFSKAQVLVGSGHGGCPSIDVGVLNKAAVRCSYEFFVSSFHPGSEQIPTAIGAWSGIFSPRELERFIQQTKREWPSRRR